MSTKVVKFYIKMNKTVIKIALISILLFRIPVSCVDENVCLDLYVEPYFDIQNISYVDCYQYFPTETSIEFSPWPEGTDVYPGDSLSLYFMARTGDLLYHSKAEKARTIFDSEQLFACTSQQNGYAGTRELIDKINISSDKPFDERHPEPGYDLSDVVKIFAYTTDGNNSWMKLTDYNQNSPYEAPKRFYLMFTQKPTLSMEHTFSIHYRMKTEQGEQSESYRIMTKKFTLK